MEPVEAKDATRAGPSRAQREDFKATSDPALQSGGRSDVKLLDYAQLYNLWERQQWATQDIDFSQDRTDWHERIP
jgi:ribonucleoside-diphosphate reductase beta chain